MKIYKFLLIVTLLATSSCVNRIIDFTAISTKNVNVDANKKNRVKGEDCTNLLFGFIPLGKVNPNIKDSIDRALDVEKGDILLDGVVYSKLILIPLVFTHYCIIAEGTSANFSK